jgi:DNA mismatch repair protein MutL
MDAPRPIRRLPEHLINQIAAGEVIERPASVLKELIENALDANASRIEIHVEQAGSSLIRVRDDGDGIAAQDLALALERHATSKLTAPSQLDAGLVTLGFRGEALPSIAAVSRLSLTSRPVTAQTAWRLQCQGGVLGITQPASHTPGTTVEVRDLFFNVPARKKFLRSDQTEYLHILRLVQAMALSHFEVDFRFYQGMRKVMSLRPALHEGERLRRIAAVLGQPAAAGSIALDAASGGLRLWGWLGLPEAARSQNDSQFIYINHRVIKDASISHAVQLAYGERLPVGRRASFVLHLEIDPALVDVNVHPAKQEVRFRDGRQVHDFVWSAVREALVARPAASAVLTAKSGGVHGQTERPVRSTVAEAAAVYAASARQGSLLSAARGGLGVPPACLHSRYVLTADAEYLEVLDIPTVREGLIHSRLRGQWQAAGAIQSLPLLMPVSYACEEAVVDFVASLGEDLNRLGFDVQAAGPQSLLIRAIPSACQGTDALALVHGLLEHPALDAVRPWREDTVGELWRTLASTAARHTPNPVSAEAMNELLSATRQQCGSGAHIPGYRRLSAEDLERLLAES